MRMRVATFNVNSVRTRLPIVLDWMQRHVPDVLCLQETKTPDSEFPEAPFAQAGYNVYYSGQKGGNGVAMLTRHPAEILGRGLDDGGPSDQARLLAARVSGITIVNTYVPQGRALDHPMFAYKIEWFARLRNWFERHTAADQPVLWLGDINVAPEPEDVHHPERHRQHVCFHDDARTAFARLRDWGFIDLFRQRHPDTRAYSFFDYRSRDAIDKGLGWRIDLMMATAALAERCLDCWIDLEPRRAERPSDHTVVAADFDNTPRVRPV